MPSLPGVHLEGPFISPERLGAQPPFTQLATLEKLRELLALDVVRLLTLAPELAGALEAAEFLAQRGIRVSIGHTKATYEQAKALIAKASRHSPTSFTHLYNAMGSLSSRDPGPLGAALASPESYAEIIYDTHHVHQGSFLSAYHAKQDKLIMVSDAIRATGMKEGLSELGGQKVMVKDGMARLLQADGTVGSLAGSVLSLEVALKNAVEAGLTLAEASHLLSRNPARYMGLKDRGTIALHKRADLVVLDRDLKLVEVIVGGHSLDQAS
ncbi:MAG: amidohydrolase family protein [Deinococcales bacterium]